MSNAVRTRSLLSFGLAAATISVGSSNTSGNPIAPISAGAEPSATPAGSANAKAFGDAGHTHAHPEALGYARSERYPGPERAAFGHRR